MTNKAKKNNSPELRKVEHASTYTPALFSFALLLSSLATAQTIQVDVTPAHATNHFRPNQTIGAGIDRIPSEAVDSGLSQPNLGRAMAAGWQPVSYRNNTELSIEAWHWNPQGAWSEPGDKGYFTGSTALGEPIIHAASRLHPQ